MEYSTAMLSNPCVHAGVKGIHHETGEPLNMESRSLLTRQRFASYLCDELAEGREDCPLQPPQQFVIDKTDNDSAERLRHCVAYAKQHDQALAREAKRRGLGVTYWADSARTAKAKRRIKLKKGVSAVQLN